MRSGDLYRLGRHLMELARLEMTDPNDPVVSQTDSSIIDVVVDHPGSSINEITAMAGFAQSHVSVSVHAMRERGWFRTSQDPADGRRTLVWAVEALSDAVARREERPAEMILASALGEPDGDESATLDRAMLTTFADTLEELHRRLTAGALHRVGGQQRARTARSAATAAPSAGPGLNARRTGQPAGRAR